jgi:hypothetical protein
MSMLIDKNTKVQTLRERSATHMSAIYASILAPSGMFGDDVMVYGGFGQTLIRHRVWRLPTRPSYILLNPSFPSLCGVAKQKAWCGWVCENRCSRAALMRPVRHRRSQAPFRLGCCKGLSEHSTPLRLWTCLHILICFIDNTHLQVPGHTLPDGPLS